MTIFTTFPRAVLLAIALLLAPPGVQAAIGPWDRGDGADVRLLAGAPGPDGRLDAGLQIHLAPGWKTYWRDPGEAGLPPDFDWGASANVAEARVIWPAPERFRAAGLNSLGYDEPVILPVEVRLRDPGAAATISVSGRVLLCEKLCVPRAFEASVRVPAGGGRSAGTAEAAIAPWLARVPAPARDGLSVGAVRAVAGGVEVEVTGRAPVGEVDLLAEAPGARFSAPVVASPGVLRLTRTGGGEAPGALRLTAISPDGAIEVVRPVTPGASDVAGLLTALALAALGGLFLNAMPCVLPLLALKLRPAAGGGAARGRLAAAGAGAFCLFAALGVGAAAAKAAGAAAGWGAQFQSPAFLALLAGALVVFAAALGGLVRIEIPARLRDRLGRPGAAGRAGADGRAGAFASGFAVALLAASCTAPFVGAAAGFAFSRGPAEIAAVLFAMGAGFAAPYFLVAALPRAGRATPRPGAWSARLTRLSALLLVLTALWLYAALWTSAGPFAAAGSAVLALGAVAAARVRAGVIAAALLAGATLAPAAFDAPQAARPDAGWAAFDPARIDRASARGEVVFVDLTAAWCLTCRVNKELVLERAPTSDALREVTAMRGDWTRADPGISAFLARMGRAGVPFNAVFGPGAPEGVVLPEILTHGAVEAALEKARGREGPGAGAQDPTNAKGASG